MWTYQYLIVDLFGSNSFHIILLLKNKYFIFKIWNPFYDFTRPHEPQYGAYFGTPIKTHMTAEK